MKFLFILQRITFLFLPEKLFSWNSGWKRSYRVYWNDNSTIPVSNRIWCTETVLLRGILADPKRIFKLKRKYKMYKIILPKGQFSGSTVSVAK